MNRYLKLWLWTRAIKYPIVAAVFFYSCSGKLNHSETRIRMDEPSKLEQEISQIEPEIPPKDEVGFKLGTFPKQNLIKAIYDSEYDSSKCFLRFEGEKKGILDYIYIKPVIDSSNFQGDNINDYITDLDIDDLDMDKWYYGLKWKF
jgi:hypothetical protein|tara:strand:- start:1206 stop:1643 length:438 start_codon:yes stop_codon:yes gene_type:complete